MPLGGISIEIDFHSAPPESVAATLAGDFEESEVLNPGPAVPQKEERKQHLAQVLIAANPHLSPFVFGFPEIAAFHSISEDEARLRYRHIELNGPEDGNGIQITLFDDAVSITVPYWHGPERVETVFREIWTYLALLERQVGYVTYDGQLDKVLDLSEDFQRVISRYSSTVSRLPEIIASASVEPSAPKKPWWKLW